MTDRTISADEQLKVHYGPGIWRLEGPDGKPVFEVRGNAVFYHPAFGRWRDLPPGNRMSIEGVESVQVRWDHGWAVGLTLAPNGLWRRIVRWEDSSQISEIDNVARALSDICGCPLLTDDDKPAPVMRVGYTSPEPVVPPASVEPPAFVSLLRPDPLPERMQSPVHTIKDATDVRLPLRMGGGALLERDKSDRLKLTVPAGSRNGTLGTTLLGLIALIVFLAVLWMLRNESLGDNSLIGLVGISGSLVIGGLLGVLLLTRLNQQAEWRFVFDREKQTITLLTPEENKPETLPVSSLHGLRLSGQAVKSRTSLSYQRTLSLMMDSGDRVIFTEVRPTPLPPDPAVMPSLVALRRQADDQAGPSLARAGARMIAWYLDVPLAED